MSLFRRQPDLARHRRSPETSERPVPSMSYYSRRSDEALNTGRNLERETVRPAGSIARFWLRRFGLVVLLLAAVVCLVDIMTLSSRPEVVSVTNEPGGTLIHSQADYQAAASKLLAGSIWNRNKITINTDSLSQQLKAEFPELTNVSVTLPLLAHRPVVYIQPAAPALVMSSSSGTYVIGTDGTALAAATDSDALARLNLPVITDQSGLKLGLNRQVLTSNDVSFIQTVIAQLAAHQITVSAMTLPAAASELDMRIDGQPYFVKFNLQTGDARQQAGTFLATESRLQSQHIVPAQYIDVRVDGRAYYK